MPARMPIHLEQPPQALFLLVDPVERVFSLHHERREEFEREDWGLADVYRELGGGAPRSSELHERFKGFFNGQARAVIAPWRDESKLEFWAGIPEQGALLRDRALEILEREHTLEVAPQRGDSASRLDAETRSLILAHNQLDAELYAHFAGAVTRERSGRRSRRPAAQQQGTAVCVLGMSRSGTSLTARILNVLGVDLGAEEKLMRPREGNNAAGFWEHKGIADLNEEIFAALSETPPSYLQGWRWPPPLPEGWEHDPRLEPQHEAARSMLRETFGDSPLWGWKDPRNCLTLPFWQQLVPGMRYVICVRHPLDIAASLEARDGMSSEESMRLWLLYMSQAAIHTSGHPRIFVSYEDYFISREDQAERLAAFLGMPGLADAQRDEIAERLEERLWHHRNGTARSSEAEAEASLPPEAGDLYALLCKLCGPKPKPEAGTEAALDASARRAAETLAQA